MTVSSTARREGAAEPLMTRRVVGKPGLERFLAHPLKVVHKDPAPKAKKQPEGPSALTKEQKVENRRKRKAAAAAESGRLQSLADELSEAFSGQDGSQGGSADLNPLLRSGRPDPFAE